MSYSLIGRRIVYPAKSNWKKIGLFSKVLFNFQAPCPELKHFSITFQALCSFNYFQAPELPCRHPVIFNTVLEEMTYHTRIHVRNLPLTNSEVLSNWETPETNWWNADEHYLRHSKLMQWFTINIFLLFLFFSVCAKSNRYSWGMYWPRFIFQNCNI